MTHYISYFTLLLLLLVEPCTTAAQSTSSLYVRLRPSNEGQQTLAFRNNLDVLGFVARISILQTETAPLALSAKRGALLRIDCNSAEEREAILRSCREHPDILYAEPAYTYVSHSQPDDPLYSMQWYLERIDAQSAWEALVEGTDSVTIAIIDDGISRTHEDLAAAIYRNFNETEDGQDNDKNGKIDDVRGWDFVGNISVMEGFYGAFREDNNPQNLTRNHGTRVASVIGATANNNRGMSGIGRRVRLLPLKIASDDPTNPLLYRLPDAILYAVEQGAKVICIAAGRTSDAIEGSFSLAEYEAVQAALDAGCVVIASAGNDGKLSDDKVFPAHLPGVLAVGASAQDDYRLPISNFGVKTPIYAPGTTILSALQPNTYNADFAGSSAAAAIVAGGAALLALQHPDWSPQQIIQQLRSSSSAVGGQKTPFHQGQINLGRALNSNNLPGISFAQPLSPYTLRNKDGVSVSNVTSFEKYTLSFTLRNYLAKTENISVAIEIIGTSQLLSLHKDTRAIAIESWAAGEVRNLEFGIVPDLRGVYRAGEEKITRQEILLTITGENYYSAELIALETSIDTDGREKIAISPRVHLWDSARTAPVLLRNIGSDTVNLLSLEIEGEAALIAENIPNLPLRLSPRQEIEIPLRLTADAPGSYATLLQATIERTPQGGDSTASPFFTTASIAIGTVRKVRLSAASEMVEFLPLPIGSSTSQTVRVKNDGTQTVLLNADIYTGTQSSGNAFVVENMPISIAPGAHSDIVIRYTPLTTAQVRATIRLSDGEHNVDIEVKGAGVQPTERQPFFLRRGETIASGTFFELPSVRLGDSLIISDIEIFNPGNLSLSISNIDARGIGSAEMHIQPASLILEPGEKRALRLALRPTQTGEKYITIKAIGAFATSAEFGLIAPHIEPLAAQPLLRTASEVYQTNAIPNYWITAEATSVGQVSEGFIFLQNSSALPLLLTAVEFANAAEFLLTQQLPLLLSPGSDTVITFELRPITEGVKNTFVTLSYSGTTLQDKFQIQAFAFGSRVVHIGEFPEPSGEFNRSLLFETAVVGEVVSGRTNFGLINRGVTNEVATATIVGANRDDFALTNGAGTIELVPNSSIDFPVEFSPRSRGIKRAGLRMLTQSGIQYDINLQGTALPPPRIRAVDTADIGEHDRQEMFVFALPIEGEFLTEDISARIGDTEAFGLLQNREDTVAGNQAFVLFSGDTLISDTLYITFSPLADRQYSTLLELTSGTARKLVFITGTGRAPTRPRLFAQDQVRFDTVQLGDFDTRLLRIQGFNLQEDIVVSMPEHYFIRNGTFGEQQLTLIPASPVVDTVLTVIFRPRNAIGPLDGVIEITSGSLSESVPIFDGVAVPRPGLTVEEVVVLPQTIVGDSSTVELPLIGAVLMPQSNIGVKFEGDTAFRYLYNGNLYRSGDSISIPVGSGVFIQPAIQVRFTPESEGEFYGYVTFFSRTIAGVDFNRGTAVEGLAALPPSFSVSDTIINFGRVKLFDIVPKNIRIEAMRIADTLRIELAKKSPVFTFVADEITLLQSYTLQLENRRFDDDIVVVCEPTDYGIYTDTLVFTTGDVLVKIPLLAIGADTTTSISQEHTPEPTLQVLPTIAQENVQIRLCGAASLRQPLNFYVYNLIGEIVISGILEGEGDCPNKMLGVSHLPEGVYFVRMSEGKNGISFIKRR